jgi:hypothetical protein
MFLQQFNLRIASSCPSNFLRDGLLSFHFQCVFNRQQYPNGWKISWIWTDIKELIKLVKPGSLSIFNTGMPFLKKKRKKHNGRKIEQKEC